MKPTTELAAATRMAGEAVAHQRNTFIRYLFDNGFSKAKIARDFDLTRQRIDQIILETERT